MSSPLRHIFEQIRENKPTFVKGVSLFNNQPIGSDSHLPVSYPHLYVEFLDIKYNDYSGTIKKVDCEINLILVCQSYENNYLDVLDYQYLMKQQYQDWKYFDGADSLNLEDVIIDTDADGLNVTNHYFSTTFWEETNKLSTSLIDNYKFKLDIIYPEDIEQDGKIDGFYNDLTVKDIGYLVAINQDEITTQGSFNFDIEVLL